MENFNKYHKIRMLGHEENADIFSDPSSEIVIQEKIDGANFRFAFNGDKIIFGSRTQQLTSDEGEETNIAKNFRRCCQFVNKQTADLGLRKKYGGLIFFGECCVKHSLNYNWDTIPPYLGFDIFHIETGRYYNYEDVKRIFKQLNLEMVPLVKVVKAGEIKEVTDEDVPITKWPTISNPKQQAEGIVFKCYDKQIMAKYVRAKFKELNAETFGGSVKYEETDDGKFVARYCTNPRIDKQIFKLIDDGNELDMPLMKYLPKAVQSDIFEECWQDVVYSKMMLDFGKIKKMITRRCLSVLQQVIVNNSLNKNI